MNLKKCLLQIYLGLKLGLAVLVITGCNDVRFTPEDLIVGSQAACVFRGFPKAEGQRFFAFPKIVSNNCYSERKEFTCTKEGLPPEALTLYPFCVQEKCEKVDPSNSASNVKNIKFVSNPELWGDPHILPDASESFTFAIKQSTEIAKPQCQSVSASSVTWNQGPGGLEAKIPCQCTSSYTVSGDFGTNAGGARVTGCDGRTAQADPSGKFTMDSVAHGTNCSDIQVTKSGYKCEMTKQGPLALTADYSAVAGSCRQNSVPIVSPECTGPTPTGDVVLCQGDDSGLTEDTSNSLVNSCSGSDGKKCEYICKAGSKIDPSNPNNCIKNSTRSYTVSGGFGSNASGATVTGCNGQTATVDSSGNFTWNSVAEGTDCSRIVFTVQPSGYTCTVTKQGPPILSSHSSVVGSCTPVSAPGYSCTGNLTGDFEPCQGAELGLTRNQEKSLGTTCTQAKKCEYTCKVGSTIASNDPKSCVKMNMPMPQSCVDRFKETGEFRKTTYGDVGIMVRAIYCLFLLRDPSIRLPDGTLNTSGAEAPGVAFWSTVYKGGYTPITGADSKFKLLHAIVNGARGDDQLKVNTRSGVVNGAYRLMNNNDPSWWLTGDGSAVAFDKNDPGDLAERIMWGANVDTSFWPKWTSYDLNNQASRVTFINEIYNGFFHRKISLTIPIYDGGIGLYSALLTQPFTRQNYQFHELVRRFLASDEVWNMKIPNTATPTFTQGRVITQLNEDELVNFLYAWILRRDPESFAAANGWKAENVFKDAIASKQISTNAADVKTKYIDLILSFLGGSTEFCNSFPTICTQDFNADITL